ncbi:MAG: chlorite dismutase family protein [Myxococcales bacterium]|nr:chlorite dismutase family protein [Myxococcales bacterium]
MSETSSGQGQGHGHGHGHGHGPAQGASNPAESEKFSVDVAERGAPRDGAPQSLDRRLFMQLLVGDVPVGRTVRSVIDALADSFRSVGVSAVLYADANHPRGVGILTFAEDPLHFVEKVHPAVAFTDLALRPEFTMLGRTYATGYEADLGFWLLDRPRETVLHPGWDWAVWYPLRRTGAFARLEGREQGAILREHGTIGKAYGAADLAHDIRLACHGLDASDNEFVIGLIGATLHPLSHVVQSMRKTRQTAEFIEKMGPFFVGRVITRVSA